ncbi:hypothetical protein FRC11_014237, partial [Ceratobasidium sp. 423]
MTNQETPHESLFVPPDSSLFLTKDSTLTEPMADLGDPSTQEPYVPEDAGQSDETMRSSDDTKSNIDELQSTQNAVPEDEQACQYYPMLAPAATRHVEALQRLVDVANESYLTDSDGSRTQSFVEELPEFLDAAVQLISRLTGSYISTRSVSYNYQDPSVLNVYSSTITARVDRYIGNASAQDEIAYLMHEVCLHGAEQLRYVPYDLYYPPVAWSSSSVSTARSTSATAKVTICEVWQGLAEIELDMIAEQYTSSSPPPIACSQLPFLIDWTVPFSQWDDKQIIGLYRHVFGCQELLLQNNERAERECLQWMETREDEDFRRYPESNVCLDNIYTEEEAAYHQAMHKHKFGADDYTPLTAQPYDLYPEDFRRAYQHILTLDIVEFLDYLEINERLYPPQGDPNRFTHPLLRMMPYSPINLTYYLNRFEVPPTVYTYSDPQHASYGIFSIFSFICNDRALFVGDAVLGGYDGVHRVGCCILVLAKLIYDMKQNRVARGPKTLLLTWDSNEGQLLRDIMSKITSAIKRSMTNVKRPKLPPGMQTAPWRPKALLYTREGHAGITRLEWPFNHWGTDDPWANSSPPHSVHSRSPAERPKAQASHHAVTDENTQEKQLPG